MFRIFADRRFLRLALFIVAVLLAAAAVLDVWLLVNLAVQASDTSSDPATAQYTGLGIILYVILLLVPSLAVTAVLVLLLILLRNRVRRSANNTR